MYDAWAAYDGVAAGCVYNFKATAVNVAAARREAISFAAYRILSERFALSKSAATTLAVLDARLAALGYDKKNISTDPSTPAGLGNAVAAAVSGWFIDDGSFQLGKYVDPSGYKPINGFLNTGFSGIETIDVNHWQPLEVANAVDQNGLPTGPQQTYLGSQWLNVRPFSLTRTDTNRAWIDPGPPPRLGSSSTGAFRSNVVEVIRRSSQMTPDDGVTIDISPAKTGNNPLGSNEGTGYDVNPITGQPYTPSVVKRGDFARVLAEFWADGPSSETPPGHWNVLANLVSDHPLTVKRIAGTGAAVDDLEWDVKLYFALNAAVHDAACAAWALKRQYDGWRPISAVRYMGQSGQSSDPSKPSYHTNGLPLVPGLIELVTATSSLPGQRHEGFGLGSVVILAWPGQPDSPTGQHSGVKWILPANWFPYQKFNFVTPAFPGYISGHSTFSRSAAEILTAFTASPFFPGGFASYTIPANTGLTFENGPSSPVQLQWASYFDAADQAGQSRIWGGIHPPIDDFTGRTVGAQCGKSVWAIVQKYFDGSAAGAHSIAECAKTGPSELTVRYSTLRGMYYKLQSSPQLEGPYVDEIPTGFVQAKDVQVRATRLIQSKSKFFRVLSSTHP